MESMRTRGEVYMDRGDTGGADYTHATLATDGGSHLMDLSAILPPAAAGRLVHFRVKVLDDAVGSYLMLRGNGYAQNINAIRTQVVDQILEVEAWAMCDASRQVMYQTSNLAFTDIFVLVRGWMEPVR